MSSLRFAFVLLLLSACGRTQTDIQRDYAKSLYPAPIGDPAVEPPEGRALIVRVYADEAHRNLTLGWQVRFYRTVQRANRVLQQQLGVRLVIDTAKPWPRQAGLGSLDSALFDLARHDPGDDVDFVIGLTTPMPAVSSAIHQLGAANLFGKHLVLRGMDDAEEMAAFSRIFGKLDDAERDRLYAARLRHKEAVVLLHEIGHALGALHVRDKRSLMHPEVTQHASSFSDINKKLMAIGTRARGGGYRGAKQWEEARTALVAAIASTASTELLGNDRERLLVLMADPKALARTSDRVLAPKSDKPEALDAMPPPPAAPSERARALLEADDLEAANIVVNEAIAKQPDDPALADLACAIAVRREPKADATIDRCRRASELSPDAAEPLLHRAFALSQREQREEALAVLGEAEARLSKTKDAPAAAWSYLAQLYRSVNAVSAAVAAAERAGHTEGSAGIAAWAEKTRARYELPEGGRADVESAYLAGKRAIVELVNKRRLDDALRRTAEEKKRFPKLPSSYLRLCEVFAKAKRFAEADIACKAAVRERPKSARVHVAAGFASFAGGRLGQATRLLERAIALDASKMDVWSLLAAAYRATGQGGKLKSLSDRFRARFNRPLP